MKSYRLISSYSKDILVCRVIHINEKSKLTRSLVSLNFHVGGGVGHVDIFSFLEQQDDEEDKNYPLRPMKHEKI